MSKKTVALLVSLALLAIGVAAVLSFSDSPWTTCRSLLLAAAFFACVCVFGRHRVRDAALLATTLLLALAGLETFSVLTHARPTDSREAGYSVSQPILGWGPGHAGVFKQVKLASKTRAVIFDVYYTVDDHLLRKVDSAADGPMVAFFGDSMTFGTGLPDAQTLPQQLADLYGRKIGVLNFGFPGYGPQQFLRAIETGMYDGLLRGRARLFVYETSPWHAERSSCKAGFMLRAPRYVLDDRVPTFAGACYQHWATLPMQLFANTSLYHSFVEPAFGPPTRDDIELFIAILGRAGQLARELYGAPTLILYLDSEEGYLRRSGMTDEEIMQAMRAAGLEVIDATLDGADFPGQLLAIPGDSHPTGVANAARAATVKAYIARAGLLSEKPSAPPMPVGTAAKPQ